MIWIISVKYCSGVYRGVYCLTVESIDLKPPTVIRIYLNQCPKKRITPNTIKKLIHEGYERTFPYPAVDKGETILRLGYKLRVGL